MLITVTLLLVLAAFIAVLASWGWGKPALHLAVLLLAIVHLLSLMPLR
jgi:hypothetical protein